MTPARLCPTLPPCAWEHESPFGPNFGLADLGAVFQRSRFPVFRVRHEHLKAGGAKSQIPQPPNPRGVPSTTPQPVPPRVSSAMSPPGRAHLAPLSPGQRRLRDSGAAEPESESGGGGEALPGKHVGLRSHQHPPPAPSIPREVSLLRLESFNHR